MTRKLTLLFATLFLTALTIVPRARAENVPLAGKRLIELRVYHFTTTDQEGVLDRYFETALLPALHKEGIKKVGCFKALANDTASDKQFFVLTEYASFEQREAVSAKIANSKGYTSAASDFMGAPFDKPAFARLEVVLMTPFSAMPAVQAPKLSGPKSSRVYELRSYESAGEKLFQNKVAMFNKGGEVALFARLKFNAVFYGEVVAGSSMPNLMYMTSFDNSAARDEHWKAFGSDPAWKELSGLKEYANNVSKIDIKFLRATDYSDL
jgi:hypothetical protein